MLRRQLCLTLRPRSLRDGYRDRRDKYRLSSSIGVDNPTARLCFEPLQNAPAPGRACDIGLREEFV